MEKNLTKILITHNNDLLKNFYSMEAVKELSAIADVRLNGTDMPLAGDALVAAARDVDIIISDRLAPGTREVFEQLPNLAVYMRCAVDIRNIDIDAASKAGVLVVRNSAGYGDAVAETALGLVIDLGRRINLCDRLYKQGHSDQPMVLGRQLAGSTIGVIGYGSIGNRIADLAVACRMRVLVFDPYKRIVNGTVTQTDFDAVLGCDFVVCSAYATPETENMMNREAFAKMRPDAYFVNISRGVLVDETALEESLISGGIAGAGLDVGRGKDEQPNPHLAILPNVIAVPHVAGLTREATDHQAFENVQQVKDLLLGKLPSHAVNGHYAMRLDHLKED
jgi:D-3-phosphoglycerate dehydrogenase